ncbi:phosphoenolpyruvate synthase [Methylocystis bryophila]|uniref:Phosphoenolpyruvate synthase n=1 Tax=Methylocystis bryophila TaxID=655015 RepID=A0A1W6MYP9_9HYPH|nr:phosphoenolpyruvate synthase [Methylocystis bryophila]ARN82705.1 phosphoenolpyruvate synthase [Methylocystis bryophila]BDV38932.1 phosphoenolpyruvate synthase [Methylocystis bryophila]
MADRFIRFFGQIGIEDVPLVGGKNASLGEMYRQLAPRGILIPNGFAITAEAYRDALDSARAWPALEEALSGLDVTNVQDLARRAKQAREIVRRAGLPEAIAEEIRQALAKLVEEYGPELSVAVRSSATAEDLPHASFAGQHESYLNVRGEAGVLEAVVHCFASLFTDRAIRYRVDNGFDHFKVFNSVGVMKMVRSDIAASGVLFTLDTETGFEDVVFLTGSYGLGENVVQGAVDPDEFYVFKPTYRAGKRSVLKRELGAKKIKMIFSEGGLTTTRNMPTDVRERQKFCLSDEEVLTLAGQAITIEDHYSAVAGVKRPMDVEWAKDGLDGRLYIVQARPETVASRRDRAALETYRIETRTPVRIEGRAVGTKIAVGRARVISHLSELPQFVPGEILVADSTSPDWGTVMKSAAGVVTNRGGRTCHAAIVARELGIPAIVGADGATRAIRSGELISVCCAEGDIGRVYEGEIGFVVERVDLSQLPRPQTHVMLNVGNPELAFALSRLPNDGVGLARMEFIVAESIKAHPMALVHPERIADAEERAEIARLTANDASPKEFFVRRLAEGVATIAAAFYPKPVVLRMSDFKSNEYAQLLGGRAFEPVEANPMIGFRGASRYAHPAYKEGFALECAGVKRVREEMGLTNVKLMIPFCRRIDEAERVVETMAELGLKRGENGLEIYVMCEIPNNVLLIDAFSKHFDGFSIGSNDLTQLTLGVDRDSEIVAFDFDERDPGVKEIIRLAVEGARRNHRHCGICGQAPSDYPEIAEFLVRLGIDSISLNPDTVLATTRRLLEVEKALGRPARG